MNNTMFIIKNRMWEFTRNKNQLLKIKRHCKIKMQNSKEELKIIKKYLIIINHQLKRRENKKMA